MSSIRQLNWSSEYKKTNKKCMQDQNLCLHIGQVLFNFFHVKIQSEQNETEQQLTNSEFSFKVSRHIGQLISFFNLCVSFSTKTAKIDQL